VSDVGQLDNGSPYMVMEYLEGEDLAKWLQHRGGMPVEQAVEFVLQACIAVADAHALGIVHRDLKPANLFCVRRSDGQLAIKVLDFGISKMTSASAAGSRAAMTQTSAMMGTPLYMSPEQMRSSRDVDARTDIWALGAILHELIAGRPAFSAESVTELAIKVANDPPPPLRAFRPDAPPELEAVILKCLEKNRERRYANVGAFAIALLPFAPMRAKASVERISGIVHAAGLSDGALAVSASSASDRTQVPRGLSPETLPAVGATIGGSSKGRAVLFGVGLLVALAAGGAVTFFVISPKPSAPPQASQQAVTAPSTAAPTPPVALPPELREPAPAKRPEAALAPISESSVPSAQGSSSKTPPVVKPRPILRGSPPAPAAPVVAPSAPVTPAPTPETPPKPAANCDPPYYFDARGNRLFKPECM
jgi:serine/threonine-protein kinase